MNTTMALATTTEEVSKEEAKEASPEKAPPSALSEALRKELQVILETGDPRKGGQLTADVLVRLLQVAKTGRDLLVSLEARPSNIAAMIRPDDSLGLGSQMTAGMFSSNNASFTNAISPLAPAAPIENFGTTVIREVVAALKNMNQNGTSPAKLVEALAIAKEKGLTEVAKKLEEQLGVASAPEEKKPEGDSA